MNSVNAELNAVKIELAQHKYYRDENQHLTNHLQKQQTDVEEATKVGPLSLYCYLTWRNIYLEIKRKKSSCSIAPKTSFLAEASFVNV